MSTEHSTLIRAAVVRQPGGPFVIENISLADPRDDEVLVRMVAAGMCHTDMVARDQQYPVPLPAILGHEGAGIVERVGSKVRSLAPGDHVVLTFMSCGDCRSCESGAPTYCEQFFALNFNGSRIDGSTSSSDAAGGSVHDHYFGQSSFGTYAVASERNAIKVSSSAPLEYLGALGCGFQTGAGAVMNALDMRAGTSFAAFGAGAVGLAAVMAARLVGAMTIIAVDVIPSRLELAKELGATHVVNSRDESPAEAIKRITGGGVNYALEATGRPELLRMIIACLGIRGVCGVVGAPAIGTDASFDWNGLMVAGQSVRGIVEGDSVPRVFIPRLAELFAQGRFPIDRLVKFYELDEINQAAHDSEIGTAIKPVIRL
jgi:aryl-alcohol dehydrogenase